MKLQKATNKQLESLEPGTLVIVDLDEHISDFAIFRFYDPITATAVVIDCVTKMGSGGKYLRNISEYKDISIVDTLEILKEEE